MDDKRVHETIDLETKCAVLDGEIQRMAKLLDESIVRDQELRNKYATLIGLKGKAEMLAGVAGWSSHATIFPAERSLERVVDDSREPPASIMGCDGECGWQRKNAKRRKLNVMS